MSFPHRHVIVLLAIFLIPQPAAAQFCLDSDTLSAGPSKRPDAAAAGDLNNDGLLDIVTVNDTSHDVSVLLAVSAGVYGTPQIWPCGVEPVAVVLADLDQDNDLDIATANNTSDTVSLLFNDGFGGFAALDSVAAGGAPIDIAAAPFDTKDADIDLVVALAADSGMVYLENLGGGNFAAPVYYETAQTPDGMDVCDLDGDGDVDVVMSHFEDLVVATLDNRGDGTFEPAVIVPASDNVFDVVCADVDGTNGPDAVGMDAFNDSITLFLNDGAGNLSEGPSYPGGNGGFGINACDFDCDGDPDVVTSNLVSDEVVIFHNDGSGAFNTTTALPTRDNPSAVACADLFGDAAPELIVPEIGGITIVTDTCSACAVTAVDTRTPAARNLLRRAVPNPFTSSTAIAFTVPAPGRVELEVYDARGRRVRTLISRRLSAGDHSVRWRGENLPSGVYFYRLSVGGDTYTRRAVLIR